jgi:hypothetical protein
MKQTILICTLVLLPIMVYGQKRPTDCPPGTIKVDKNLYFDKTELSNKDYRVYVNWIERILGKDSREYADAIIDSNIVFYDYYKDPGFNNYPLVGVTYEQAVNYCKWRSDRVYEINLIHAGIMSVNKKQNKNNYFSIDRVLNGIYKIRKPEKLDKIPIPHYRLPTIEEWEHAALDGSEKNVRSYAIDTLKSDQNKPIAKDSIRLMKVDTNEKVKPNIYGLINMNGNVAEMVDKKGIAKGCSWMDKIGDCEIKNNRTYSKPEIWLGFRCVCEYRVKK